MAEEDEEGIEELRTEETGDELGTNEDNGEEERKLGTRV